VADSAPRFLDRAGLIRLHRIRGGTYAALAGIRGHGTLWQPLAAPPNDTVVLPRQGSRALVESFLDAEITFRAQSGRPLIDDLRHMARAAHLQAQSLAEGDLLRAAAAMDAQLLWLSEVPDRQVLEQLRRSAWGLDVRRLIQHDQSLFVL
jgi:hypothetical protein